MPCPDATSTAPAPPPDGGDAWLRSFHRGDRVVLEGCYRAHFAAVERAVGWRLQIADRETVVHEVFSRLIDHEELRRSFQGGSLAAWLATIARNQAIDFQRRLSRERPLAADRLRDHEPGWGDRVEARLLIEQFRRERLRPEWSGVFELRFLRDLSQREAARALGIRRTTLSYRELRIRRALRRFVKET